MILGVSEEKNHRHVLESSTMESKKRLQVDGVNTKEMTTLWVWCSFVSALLSLTGFLPRWIISSKNWGPLFSKHTHKIRYVSILLTTSMKTPLRDFYDVMSFPHIACFVCFLNQRWLYLGELLFHSPRKMICVDMHFFVFIYKSWLWLCGSQIVDHIRSQHVFTYFLWTYCLPCCGPLPYPKLAASNWRWWFLFGIQEDSYCWNPVCHFILVCQCIPFCTWFQFITNSLWGFNSSQLVISKLITARPHFFGNRIQELLK